MIGGWTIRLEPRLAEPGILESSVRLAIGVVCVVALGALILVLSGNDPLVAYGALLRGGFGTLRAFSGTLNKAVPIGLCALGIALAYRARLWNIGAEGQLYFGALAATGVGLALPDGTASVWALMAVLGAGMAGGAFWAALAAIPRAYLGMNEILSTLMLNYVAILWVSFMVDGPWADPLAFSFPFSAKLPDEARIGRMVGSVHWGVIALVVGCAVLYAIDRGLRIGYELRIFGNSPDSARFAGISSVKMIVFGLLMAGAAAGLAGAIEVSASTGRLQQGLSPGYGFMAILVAWLANGNPVGIVVASIMYAGLLNGGFSLQVSGIPPSIGTILQATLLISVMTTLGLGRYRLRLFRGEPVRP